MVVSDIPGNVEALGDPPAGLVYPLRDRDALAAALNGLAASAELRRELGEKAVCACGKLTTGRRSRIRPWPCTSEPWAR